MCVIFGPLDMEGIIGAAAVMGSLMYATGQVSPSLLADLRCFSFVWVVFLFWLFVWLLVLVAVACFGFLSPSVSCRLTFACLSNSFCSSLIGPLVYAGSCLGVAD